MPEAQVDLRAPFPWFGGKRRVADVVWRAFGPDVNNYVEPFAGSLAVLLGRPGGPGKIETVNDISRFLANFWRAVKYDPAAVAEACDWPVNEADLHARHRWLVAQLPVLRTEMHKDPHFYDAQIAGWWVWGICQWIGGGWCAEPNNHKHPKLDGIGKGVHSDRGHPRGRDRVEEANRPELGGAGKGVHGRRRSRHTEAPSEQAKRPNLAGLDRGALRVGRTRAVRSHQRPMMQGDSTGMGVHSQQLPKLSVFDGCEGVGGVHANRRPKMSVHLPSLGNDRGILGVASPPCLDWFLALQQRFRRVRVACGDWKRVLGPSVLGKGKNVGGRRPCAVFLDPPYSHEVRDIGLYADDAAGLSDKVREWALAYGGDPELRIALCGYAGEHEMPGWREYSWKAARGYAAEDNDNRERERIWFSPHCLQFEDRQLDLFAGQSVTA